MEMGNELGGLEDVGDSFKEAHTRENKLSGFECREK